MSVAKCPTMNIFLDDAHRNDEQAAEAMQKQLCYTTLKKVVAKSSIHFDPDSTTSSLLEDKLLVEDFFSFEQVLEMLHYLTQNLYRNMTGQNLVFGSYALSLTKRQCWKGG